MNKLLNVILGILFVCCLSSCEYFYSLDLENRWEKGIYIWSQSTGLKTGDDPKTVDDLTDLWYLHYVKPGDMGSFGDVITGGKRDAKWVADDVFWGIDTLLIAIFDAKELDENWGVGKMSDYVIQKYWLVEDDVIEKDGKTYKDISFPPNEGMKNIKMDPPYGSYLSR